MRLLNPSSWMFKIKHTVSDNILSHKHIHTHTNTTNKNELTNLFVGLSFPLCQDQRYWRAGAAVSLEGDNTGSIRNNSWSFEWKPPDRGTRMMLPQDKIYRFDIFPEGTIWHTCSSIFRQLISKNFPTFSWLTSNKVDKQWRNPGKKTW